MTHANAADSLRFLSAVDVWTAYGTHWIAAVFHSPVGLVEAVYRVSGESADRRSASVAGATEPGAGGALSPVFETAYLGATGYWDREHPFWGRLVVLRVCAAPPNAVLTIPASAIRSLIPASSLNARPRQFMRSSAGGRGRRALLPVWLRRR